MPAEKTLHITRRRLGSTAKAFFSLNVCVLVAVVAVPSGHAQNQLCRFIHRKIFTYLVNLGIILPVQNIGSDTPED